MREYPILFSGEMVRAILNGQKTQTRRVIKPQPSKGMTVDQCHWVESGWALWDDKGCTCKTVRCPYGFPGDILWVRETWLQDGEIYLYKANFGKGVLSDSWDGHWKPSIFMPRRASRILLKISSIRVQRLRDISHEDAVAEGFWNKTPGEAWGRLGFSLLWDKLNAKRGYSWDSNPWVFVIDFS
jgi:hypothetical protein